MKENDSHSSKHNGLQIRQFYKYWTNLHQGTVKDIR